MLELKKEHIGKILELVKKIPAKHFNEIPIKFINQDGKIYFNIEALSITFDYIISHQTIIDNLNIPDDYFQCILPLSPGIVKALNKSNKIKFYDQYIVAYSSRSEITMMIPVKEEIDEIPHNPMDIIDVLSKTAGRKDIIEQIVKLNINSSIVDELLSTLGMLSETGKNNIILEVSGNKIRVNSTDFMNNKIKMILAKDIGNELKYKCSFGPIFLSVFQELKKTKLDNITMYITPIMLVFHIKDEENDYIYCIASLD